MQFLPQDKVVSFAGLKPEELLRETLAAMGDMELHNQHQELIKMQKDLKVRESVCCPHMHAHQTLAPLPVLCIQYDAFWLQSH